MKHRMLKLGLVLIIILSLLTSTAAYAVVGDTVYTNTRWLADNLEYRNTVAWCPTFGRTESFSIRMTGPGDAYPIVMSGDTIFGSTRISTMVAYAESLGKNVLAVVNTDFFSLQTGVPLGIVIEDGVYKSSPSDRGAVCFGYDGEVSFIEEPVVRISLLNNGGAEEVDNTGKTVYLRNFNKMRADTGGMYLFSEAFSTVSTRTSSPGWFVKFRILEGAPSVSGEMTLEVTEMLMSDGEIPIGEGYLVLSAARQSGFGAEYEKFAVGDIVTLTTTCNDEGLENAQHATGAGDVLISNGVKTDVEGWDPPLLPRAPRTAFGVRADGTVISFVMDGRNSQHSVGMTLEELADELLRQGCVYAVNFDGGGSTALSVRIPGERTAAVVSRPSGGSERGCATYILFVTDAIPDGAARNISLRNDGVIVLAESSVELSFAATDSGYMPARTPTDIEITPLLSDATVDGTIYTADGMAGVDRLDLYSPSTGAFGTGEVYVITRPTSVIPSRKGSSTTLTSVRLSPGATLELSITATYYRRAVAAQAHSFTYTVSGDIGEMTEPGVFVAGQAAGQKGTITVSAGGRSAEIRVEVDGFSDMLNHWAKEYAEYLAATGVTVGVTPTEYGPELLMKRGDYILMLHRAAGLPEPETMESFDDVPQDEYYAKALAWAKEADIADGSDENHFQPQSPVSRQDAFTFTYRALSHLNKQYTDGTAADIAGFPDAGTLDDYAVVPTATLIKLGIVEGMDGILSPHSTLTRAQMAKVLAVVLQLP